MGNSIGISRNASTRIHTSRNFKDQEERRFLIAWGNDGRHTRSATINGYRISRYQRKLVSTKCYICTEIFSVILFRLQSNCSCVGNCASRGTVCRSRDILITKLGIKPTYSLYANSITQCRSGIYRICKDDAW